MNDSGTSYRTLLFMAILSVMIGGGCNSLKTSGIDPTGEHVFVQPPAIAGAANQAPVVNPLPWDLVTLILTPSVTVAPVGSEVVLIAGVGSADGSLRTNQRLQWSIASGSVGQFTEVGKNDFVDILLFDYNQPRLVNSAYAIGSTSSKYTQVKQGPSAQTAETPILPGQGWIKITSPIEGTSIVNAVAPKIIRPDQRMKTATIHWIDATWRFPPPAINSAGTKRVLTTTVMRQSNQCPVPGWRVKYTIIGGPAAGFSPDGASSTEVTTDAAGQANAEIFQKTPSHGTNQIGIEVIRPAELVGSSGQGMTVGTGSTMQTWTAADIGLKLSGPSMTEAGSTPTYRLEVSNPGDLPSKGIIVLNALPDGLGYISSNPPAEIGGKRLQWRLGDLGPRQRQTIEVTVRAEKEGSVSNCAEVTTAGGLKVSDCATTTITTATSAVAAAPAGGAPSSIFTSDIIELKVLGPNVASVDSKVTFNITLTNRSRSNLNDLIIKDRFEPGLENLESPEKRLIETKEKINIPPGRTYRVDLEFRVSKAGNLCHTVEALRQNDILGRVRSCVMVSAQSTPPPGIAPPGGRIPSNTTPGTTPGTAPSTLPGYRPENAPGNRYGNAPPAQPPLNASAEPVITVKQTCDKQQCMVGEIATFTAHISNPNNRPLSNVKAVYHFDPALVPKQATRGYQIEGVNLTWAIQLLPAGGSQQIVVQCQCDKPAFKACNTVVVTCNEGAKGQGDAYLEIRSPPGMRLSDGTTPGETQSGENRSGEIGADSSQPSSGLTMTVAALRGPVAAGEELAYLINVTNGGNTVHRQLTVTAMIPDGMTPVPLGTVGPGPTKFVVDRQTVRFNPVLEVQPGETLVYRVRARTKTAGKFSFLAELTAQNLAHPILKEASTEVFNRE